jgi:predicted heme/steroid binding protein
MKYGDNNMKKSIILIFCLALVLSSCTKKASVPASQTQTTTPIATATPTSVPSPNTTAVSPTPETKKATEQPATATSGKNTTANTPVPTSQPTTAPKSDVKTFNSAELAKYDGQNGNPAYIAVDGNVYDVTNSKEWRGGSHKGNPAGLDYTSEFAKQHNASTLAGLKIVGKYVN